MNIVQETSIPLATGLPYFSSLFSSDILMKTSEAALLYDLFLAFNRRLRTIIQKLRPPLLLIESHMLGEINQQHIVNTTTLLQTLTIEKTKVSRTTASFLERGWIEVQQSQADKRVRYFTITEKGKDVFLADNEFRNTQVMECFVALSQSERKDLARFINTMADGLGASSIASLPGDSIGKVEIRRLTRAMGLLGDNLLNLGLPLDECQLLHIVHRDGNCVSMATLKTVLPYEMTLISRLSTFLAEQNLLKKKPLPFDKRHVQVLLTPTGIARAQKNLQNGGNRLLGSLSDYSPAARRQLISLLEKMLYYGVDQTQNDENKKYALSEIKSEEDRQIARSMLIETLVAQKRVNEIRESILHPDNICFQVKNEGEICAVCEAQLDKNTLTILYYIAAPDIVGSGLRKQMIIAVVEAALASSDASKLLVKGIDLLPDDLKLLLNAKKNEVSYKSVLDLI